MPAENKPQKIVLASGNSGKLREIQAVLNQQQFQLIKQSEFNVPDVAETGAPCVYSARYAGTHGEDDANNSKLLAEMKNVAEKLRTARFQCVIVYMQHAEDPMPLICEGTWEGKILHNLSGPNGFGYDPLFYVPTHKCSSAELEPAEKNRISHRAQALKKLIATLN